MQLTTLPRRIHNLLINESEVTVDGSHVFSDGSFVWKIQAPAQRTFPLNHGIPVIKDCLLIVCEKKTFIIFFKYFYGLFLYIVKVITMCITLFFLSLFSF